MAVSVLQNGDHTYYRVSVTINSSHRQRCFPFTPIGKATAETLHASLMVERAQYVRNGAKSRTSEFGSKGFKTGVPNIALTQSKNGLPYFTMICVLNGVKTSKASSIIKNGYTCAWRKVVEELWLAHSIGDQPIPRAPSRSKARLYLRSIGVMEFRLDLT